MKNKKKILKTCKSLREAAEKLNITVGEAKYWVKRLGVVLSDDQEKKAPETKIKGAKGKNVWIDEEELAPWDNGVPIDPKQANLDSLFTFYQNGRKDTFLEDEFS